MNTLAVVVKGVKGDEGNRRFLMGTNVGGCCLL